MSLNMGGTPATPPLSPAPSSGTLSPLDGDGSMAVVPGSRGAEVQRVGTSPAACASLGTKKPPIERTLSHQNSSIHVEWYSQLARTESDHVQLSLGEPLPLPASASAKRGQAGKGKKKQRAVAEVPGDGEGDGGGEEEPACCRGTLAPGDTYLRLACWLALLFAGYGFQRGLCAGGLPYDCDAVDAAEVYSTLTSLAFVGGGLGWLAGVTRPARFAWLASWRRAYLWVAYAAMLPAYSAISSIPAMHESLSQLSTWSAAAIAVVSSAAAVVIASIAFHIWLATYPASHPADSNCKGAAVAPEAAPVAAAAGAGAGGALAAAPDSPGGSNTSRSMGSEPSAEDSFSTFDDKRSIGSGGGSSQGSGSPRAAAKPARRPARRRRCLPTLRRYLLPRSAVLLYFVVWFGALAGSGSFDLHLHHYALGWAVASLAAFNHPVSGMQLALGTAVFVQGAGSYGFDALFTPAGNSTGGCLNVTSPQSGQMTCAFWANQPFNLSFCSESNWVPWFDCTVEWPWPQTKITKKMLRTGSHKRNLSLMAPMPLTPLVPLITG